jgi:hypothetical protein
MKKNNKIILLIVVTILLATNLYWSIRENAFEKEFYSIHPNEIIDAEISEERINYNKIEDKLGSRYFIKDPKIIEMVLNEVRDSEIYRPNHHGYNNKFLLTLRTKIGRTFHVELNTMKSEEYIFIFQIEKGFGTSYYKKLKSKKLYGFMKSKKIIP